MTSLQFKENRDKFFKTTLSKGKYIVVPITTGALMKRPYNQEPKLYLDLPKEYRYGELHPFFDSVIGDIFRKFDICWNNRLDATEISSFGKIIKNEYFITRMNIDFQENISEPNEWIDIKGMTEYGFKKEFVNQVNILLTSI